MAEKAFLQRASHPDQQLLGVLAHMRYALSDLENKKYMGLKLGDQIDNVIVAEKSKLLDKLEKGYQGVILLKAPKWALMACYQSYIVNSEFSRFLKESPLPNDLTPEQKDQYTQIIQEKSRAYQDKADQYLKTCILQGHKWEICDPELAGYFNPSAKPGDSLRKCPSFSGTTASAEIGGQCLLDQELKGLHEKLLKGKNDPQTLLGLCEVYMQRGDYRHAILIAQKALDEKIDQNVSLKASLYNCIGVSNLYISNDMMAKDAFLKAISIDANHIGARLNLAGLFKHYGHDGQASQLYQGLGALFDIEKSGDAIHPRAKELFHASKNISKN
jgi:cellulose synthase operon protein C